MPQMAVSFEFADSVGVADSHAFEIGMLLSIIPSESGGYPLSNGVAKNEWEVRKACLCDTPCLWTKEKAAVSTAASLALPQRHFLVAAIIAQVVQPCPDVVHLFRRKTKLFHNGFVHALLF